MPYAILTKSLDELAQIMKLPDEYTLVSAQFDMHHGSISFLVESSKLPEKDKEQASMHQGKTTMDVVYSEERLGAGIDFTKVTPMIFVDGKEFR